MTVQIILMPYSQDDLPLLDRANTPEMTEHLGGPESDEQVRRRHQRYLEKPETGGAGMYKIVSMEDGQSVGLIGYWERKWHGEMVWETGWSIFSEHQGKGFAKAATLALIEKVMLEKSHRFLHAFPSVDNPPSNAICRSAGFTLLGEYDFEYPPGHMMRCNDWQIDLMPDRS